MAGRKPYKPTEADIETVRALKETGASDKACAKALDISPNTFGRCKKVFFESPIKKAQETRAKTHLELAQDALALRLQQRVVTEKTTVTKTIGDQQFEEIKEVEKVIQPSDTLVMFTLVNRSDGEWKSINKVENTINNHSTEEKPTIQFTKKRNVDTPES